MIFWRIRSSSCCGGGGGGGGSCLPACLLACLLPCLLDCMCVCSLVDMFVCLPCSLVGVFVCLVFSNLCQSIHKYRGNVCGYGRLLVCLFGDFLLGLLVPMFFWFRLSFGRVCLPV